MPLAPEQTAAELLDALREQPEKADAYLSAEGSYRAFVQEQDVTLPAQIRAQLAPILDEFCREYGSADSLTPERHSSARRAFSNSWTRSAKPERRCRWTSL